MVTKNKRTSKTVDTKSRVKVGRLHLGKETIKDLTPGKQKRVKGGAIGAGHTLVTCRTCGSCVQC